MTAPCDWDGEQPANRRYEWFWQQWNLQRRDRRFNSTMLWHPSERGFMMVLRLYSTGSDARQCFVECEL